MRTPLAADTTLEVETRQIEAWRRMSPAEKIALVHELSAAARAVMLAGIRHRHPDAGEREVFLRIRTRSSRSICTSPAAPRSIPSSWPAGWRWMSAAGESSTSIRQGTVANLLDRALGDS